MEADLEQVDKNKRASEFHNVKLNAKEMISPKLGTIHKNRRWTFKIYWRRSGSENSNLSRYHQVRGEVQEDLLGESDGFPPSTKAGSHCKSTQALFRDQRYPHQSCIGKKQTYAVYYR